jgi:Holliday junction resolvase RusA-like endonuclease
LTLLRQIDLYDTDTVSPNVMLRAHWAVRKKWKQKYQRLFSDWLQQNGDFTCPKPVHIDITRCVAGRGKMMDPDNLVGSVKLLIDALRECGILYDDTPECVSIQVNQKWSKQKCTRVAFYQPD